MSEFGALSALTATKGVTQRDNSDSTPSFNLNDELKKKDIFSVAQQHPCANIQTAGASIW